MKATEKRLIYAEDLFEPVDFKVLQVRKGGPGGGKTMAMYEQLFRKRVEMAPTVNAVEVVRCKGCLNYKETIGGKPCGYGRCLHPSGLKAMVFDESFCPYGERREGE